MLRYKKVRVGKNYIEAFSIRLQSKTFILLKGRKGYVMCGYLNLVTARKFGDVAVKITGISTIEEALKAKVHSFSPAAKRLGIFRGQPVVETLKIIT